MKLSTILALFTLVVIVKGSFIGGASLAAVVAPVIFTIGSVLTEIKQDVLDVLSFNLRKTPLYKLSSNNDDDFEDDDKNFQTTERFKTLKTDEEIDELMAKTEEFEK